MKLRIEGTNPLHDSVQLLDSASGGQSTGDMNFTRGALAPGCGWAEEMNCRRGFGGLSPTVAIGAENARATGAVHVCLISENGPAAGDALAGEIGHSPQTCEVLRFPQPQEVSPPQSFAASNLFKQVRQFTADQFPQPHGSTLARYEEESYRAPNGGVKERNRLRRPEQRRPGMQLPVEGLVRSVHCRLSIAKENGVAATTLLNCGARYWED